MRELCTSGAARIDRVTAGVRAHPYHVGLAAVAAGLALAAAPRPLVVLAAAPTLPVRRYYRTDRDGTVQLQLGRGGLRVETER
jgi:hypothetical protein